MKTISTTYCKRFDNSCYHHQCIVDWTAVIILQVHIGHSGEKRCEKWKTQKNATECKIKAGFLYSASQKHRAGGLHPFWEGSLVMAFYHFRLTNQNIYVILRWWALSSIAIMKKTPKCGFHRISENFHNTHRRHGISQSTLGLRNLQKQSDFQLDTVTSGDKTFTMYEGLAVSARLQKWSMKITRDRK